MLLKILPFVLTLGLVPLPAQAASFVSTLTGSQEVPPVTTPGQGTAIGQLTGGPGNYVFSYTVNFSGLTGGIVNPPGAHIHNAPAGVNGPVVHILDGLAGLVGSTSGTFTGDWTSSDSPNPLTDTLVTALLRNELYFNLHTATFRSGEIRGQIILVPEPSLLLALLAVGLLGGRSLKA